jgi:hypothetical protein
LWFTLFAFFFEERRRASDPRRFPSRESDKAGELLRFPLELRVISSKECREACMERHKASMERQFYARESVEDDELCRFHP